MATENDRDDELDAERTQSFTDDRLDRPARDTGDWLDAIGPEDMSRARVIDNLEEFGFDLQDDDDELSLESTGQEFGGGYENGAYTDVEEIGDLIDQDTPLDANEVTSLRPTEDAAEDDLDGDDAALDDELPTGDTRPSGLQPTDAD